MPKFREITGQFVGYIPDSIDADIVPDRAPMNGRVTFTPVFTGGVIAFPELMPPEFAHPRTIHAKIVDGFVQVEVNEGEGDDEHIVLQPLSLMVTVDDEASQVWSWRAEFDEILIGASDEYVQIPSWSFRVPDGTGPVDLTELVPLKSTGSVDVTKGPRGAGLENITAVDGQLVFAYTDGEETTVPIPEAVQGPQGEPGPAGADGEQGPEGPQGPAGEIPDLLVGNITDATPTGKNLMLAATEGAARNALGLAAGATAINGALSELENGVSNNPRVWTPANLANYVGGKVEGLATTTEAETYTNQAVLAATEALIADPLMTNSVTVKAIVKFRESASEGTWVQGFNYDPTDNVYYLGTQDTASYNILRVDAETGNELDRKTFDITPGAYTESLPYWRNGSGHLCFMVRTGASSTEATYNIFDYTVGSLGPQIAILGNWRAATDGKILVTSNSRTTNIGRFFVYDWESVKAGSPALLSTVYPASYGDTGRKNQGLQVVGGNIYLQQATVGEPPTLNRFTMGGVLESTTQWELDEFAALVNGHTSGTITDPGNFKSEGEGLAELGGRLLSGWSVNEGEEARFVIVSHGELSGTRMNAIRAVDNNAADSTNVTLGGLNCWFKRQGNFVSVWIDGSLTTAIAAGATVTVGTIEAKYRPARTFRWAARVGSGSLGLVAVLADGSVQVNNLGTASAGWVSAFSAVYDITF